MRFFIFIIIAFQCTLHLFAHKNGDNTLRRYDLVDFDSTSVSGEITKYYTGEYITINDSVFYYNSLINRYYVDSEYGKKMNRGKLSAIGDNYYLLNTDVYDLPEMNYQIEYGERIDDDSIHIKIRVPKYNIDKDGQLEVPFYISFFLCTNRFECDASLISTKECEVAIDRNAFFGSMRIFPAFYPIYGIYPSRVNGMTVYEAFLFLPDENGTHKRLLTSADQLPSNNLILTMSDLTEDLFKRTFFDNEIIRMTDEEIFFRGSIYQRTR